MNPSVSVGRSHGAAVVYDMRGRLSNVAFGCRISYKNSGMIGTVHHPSKTVANEESTSAPHDDDDDDEDDEKKKTGK